jgi:hypothetical protein
MSTYNINDVVEFAGSSYISLSGSTGIPTPPFSGNWALMAQAGTSGTDGTSGSSGSSGTNGTSGVSMSIYDEGTLIKSGVAAINFQGVCATSSESVSADTVNVKIGSQWLISSHSFSFEQDILLNPNTYYIGDETSGWDASRWGLYNSPSFNILLSNGNVGIPSPFNIISGDVITVCGLAYSDIPASPPPMFPPVTDFVRFGVSLSVFNCSNLEASSPPLPAGFPQTGLTTSAYTYTPDNMEYVGEARVCFELTYTAQYDFPKCDTLFVLGFNNTNLMDSNFSQVKVTYTFNVNRNC